MLSLRALGNLTNNGSAAKAAAHYYSERSMDYYAEDFKEDQEGKWIGSGCEHFGVEGGINRLDLQMALAGSLAGHEVRNVGKPNRQIGWDLTFSAPKSVSVLWASSDHVLKREVEELHQRAVKASFEYLESKIVSRMGNGGIRKVKADLAAGVFTHYTSRAGDPQLHSHVVVPNICVRNGSVGTIKSKEFYEYKMTAGALYQAEFAYLLQERGFAVENGVKGTFRLVGLDENIEKLFSKRGRRIDQVVKEIGVSSYVGSRNIVVNTRMPKQKTTLLEREEFWGKEIEGNELVVRFDKKMNRVKSADIYKEVPEIVNKANQNITSSQSVYKEKDIVREIARESLGVLNVKQILEVFGKAQEQNIIVKLGVDSYNSEMFSTPEMIKIEKEMIRLTRKMISKTGFSAENQNVISSNVRLSEEQKRAVESVSGDSQIVVVQGRAGTGKTTLVNCIKQIYESEGYHVSGLCLSGQAAQNLEKETGVKSQTIALWELKKEKFFAKQVYVVDEAGMVGSKQMTNILKRANQNNAKVVLVGDEHQLQPINAGGALSAIDKEIVKIAPQYSSQIETIRRQKHQWMKDIVCYAAKGEINKSIDILVEKKRIKVFRSAKLAKEKLVGVFMKDCINKQEQGQILTHRKIDTYQINDQIREKLKELGSVEREGILTHNGQRKIELSKGDKIVLLKNDYKLDVRNGQQANVVSVNKKTNSVQILLADDQIKVIDLEKYSKIEYGWAITTHKAQGMTVDKTYIYGFAEESMASQQATYVQLSRQREDLQLFIVDGECSIERDCVISKISENEHNEAINELKKSWGKDRAKDVTLDYVDQKVHFNEQKKNVELEQGLLR